MRKFLSILLIIFFASNNIVFAEGDLWDNFGDSNIYGQKPVSDKEFEQALESKKGKKKRDKNIPKGESFADVRSRAEDFLRDIPSGRESKGEKMLIVAHKGTLGHLLAAMLKLPLDGYWNFVFEQGCYSVVDLEDGYAIIRKLNASILVEGEPASVKSVK